MAKAKTNKAPAAKEIYTTRDLAEHFKLNAKSLRRKMRAKGITVGKGNRHAFSPDQYQAIIKRLQG